MLLKYFLKSNKQERLNIIQVGIFGKKTKEDKQ